MTPTIQNMKKNTKKTLATLTACAMLGAVAVGGTLAYLTDNEATTNTITIGEVKIDLLEPAWPDQTPGTSDDVVLKDPTEEIAKNPQIKNSSTTDEAIVFMSVEVPKQPLTLLNLDGSVKAAYDNTIKQEIVNFKLNSDDDGNIGVNNFNDDTADITGAPYWIELNKITTSDDVNTYVFAYSTKLAKETTTEPLFEKIQVVNCKEGEITASAGKNIKVTAYAIQANDVKEYDGTTTTDLTDELTKTNLQKIFNIFMNQNGNTGFVANDAVTDGPITSLTP